MSTKIAVTASQLSVSDNICI
uniref:Uncharacterized protein n=1 Tax=Rhizophora mucronata TaxID=61149 RepID=A0A2P2NLC2_RHIMU